MVGIWNVCYRLFSRFQYSEKQLHETKRKPEPPQFRTIKLPIFSPFHRWFLSTYNPLCNCLSVNFDHCRSSSIISSLSSWFGNAEGSIGFIFATLSSRSSENSNFMFLFLLWSFLFPELCWFWVALLFWLPYSRYFPCFHALSEDCFLSSWFRFILFFFWNISSWYQIREDGENYWWRFFNLALNYFPTIQIFSQNTKFRFFIHIKLQQTSTAFMCAIPRILGSKFDDFKLELPSYGFSIYRKPHTGDNWLHENYYSRLLFHNED